MPKPDLKLEKDCWDKGLSLVAGIDEAGRGALAGPLVATAVIFPPHQKAPEGIDDSKKLTPTRREKLASEIIKRALCFGIGKIASREIDQKGITWATQQAFYQAIQELEPCPHFIYSDAYQLEKITHIQQKAIIKGDQKVISIAAASILAKVYRDWLMATSYHQRFPQYNFRQHKGYGTREHLRLVRQLGACQIHRRTYLKNIFS